MSQTLDPALTPEEWASLSATRSGEAVDASAGYLVVEEAEPDWEGMAKVFQPATRHALAALALHQQPFGFTWADEDLLRHLTDRHADSIAGYGVPFLDLASRIEALLPPRST